MRQRQRKPRPEIVLPQLKPHHHEGPCDCELAVPYIRVSKVGTREKIISPETQLRECERCAVKNNLRLLPPVFDIDKSGRTFRKRSVDAMIADISAGKYSRVVLWKWSRWARNREESAIYSKAIRAAGGVVESATEDFDLETAIGQLQFGMTQEFDQYQSNLIAEGWQSAQARRRDLDLPHSGRERIGYDYVDCTLPDGTKSKRYVPNEEAPILAKGYELYVGGGSLNAVARLVNDEGLRSAFGALFTGQSIGRLMDNGFAAGLIRERSKPGGSPANSIANYDVWRAGAHEAVIDRDTWGKYKARRFAQADLPPRSKNAVHELSALLFCGMCRRRMVTKYSGQAKSHMWVCPYQRVYHPGQPVSVNNRLALDVVRDWVRGEVGDVIDLAEQKAEAEALLSSAREKFQTERQRIQAQIKELDGKIDNLLDFAESATGRAKERTKDRMALYEAESDRLSKLLAENTEPDAPRVFGEDDAAALKQMKEIWGTLPAQEMRDSLADLIQRIEVSPRTEASSRKSAADRVFLVAAWEVPDSEIWSAGRPK